MTKRFTSLFEMTSMLQPMKNGCFCEKKYFFIGYYHRCAVYVKISLDFF